MPRLKKRADGRYQANVVMGYDADGKTIIKRVYGNTEAELNAAKDNAKKLAGLGDFSTATVGEWLDEWLRIRQMDVDEETLSERTYDTYDDVIRLHLKPKLGAIGIQSLQPDVSAKKIQLLMGHASATFTMDTYIHKTETMMDGIKEKLETRK